MVDEPKTTSIYGGMLAAPIFQIITERTLKYLSMKQKESFEKKFEKNLPYEQHIESIRKPGFTEVSAEDSIATSKGNA